MLELLIKRSGATELDVVVLFPILPKAFTPKASSLVLGMLPRTRRLVLDMPAAANYKFLDTIPIFPIRNAPYLQELQLVDLAGVYSPLFAMSSNAPLRTLDLRCSEPRIDVAAVPSQHIRILRFVNTPFYAGIKELIERCPKLHTVTLGTIDHISSREPIPWPISLNVLEIHCGRAGIGAAISSLALCTNLTHFTLRSGSYYMGFPRGSVPAPPSLPLLPSLLSVAVCLGPDWAPHIHRLLRRAPNLVALEMNVALIEPVMHRFQVGADGTKKWADREASEAGCYDELENIQLLRVVDDLEWPDRSWPTPTAERLMERALRKYHGDVVVEWWLDISRDSDQNFDSIHVERRISYMFMFDFDQSISPLFSDLDLYGRS